MVEISELEGVIDKQTGDVEAKTKLKTESENRLAITNGEINQIQGTMELTNKLMTDEFDELKCSHDKIAQEHTMTLDQLNQELAELQETIIKQKEEHTTVQQQHHDLERKIESHEQKLIELHR